MNFTDSTKAVIVRIVLLCCISISISLMYYENVMKRNYHIYTNPDGPDLSV